MKNSMIALSIGAAFSDVEAWVPPVYNSNGWQIIKHGINYDRYGISFPIEFKIYALARNFIGIGLFISTNITPKYCPVMIAPSVVFGGWNKSKTK